MGIARGIVKFFNADRKFGFVTVLDDEGNATKHELYFHYNDGFFMRMGDTEPEFSFKTGTIVDGKGIRNVDKPKPGASIVFVGCGIGKNLKVEKWAFAANYDSFGQVTSNPTMSP